MSNATEDSGKLYEVKLVKNGPAKCVYASNLARFLAAASKVSKVTYIKCIF